MIFRVERLEPAAWRRWRSVRLRALSSDPAAFASSAHAWLGGDAPEQRWRDRIRAPGRIFLAVDEDGHDVGMVGLTLQPAELISMWVAPEARNTGVGRALVAAVRDEAGDEPLRLRVMAVNETAIAFYAGCGFELLGREPDDEGTLTMTMGQGGSGSATRWPAPAERPLRPSGSPRAPMADQ